MQSGILVSRVAVSTRLRLQHDERDVGQNQQDEHSAHLHGRFLSSVKLSFGQCKLILRRSPCEAIIAL